MMLVTQFPCDKTNIVVIRILLSEKLYFWWIFSSDDKKNVMPNAKIPNLNIPIVVTPKNSNIGNSKTLVVTKKL